MVKEFKITLNEPSQQVFFPGSEVSGTLSFVVQEPKSCNYIQVALHGDAYVHWTETQGTGDNSREESYTAQQIYVKFEELLWTRQQVADGKLQPGQYNYPFQFFLPPQLPSSFKGSVGSIKYYVEGKIGAGVFRFDQKIQVEVPVVEIVNIGFPRLQVPIQQQTGKKVLFSGHVNMSANLLRTGYCIGDTISPSVTIQNGTKREIKVRAEVHQKVTYHAQGCCNYGGRGIVASVTSEALWPTNTTISHLEIKVPPVEPTLTSCSIITVEYFLIVAAVIPWAINLQAKFPITIGNVPLQDPNGATGYPPVAAAPPYQTVGPGDEWTTDMPPSYDSVVGAAANYS